MYNEVVVTFTTIHIMLYTDWIDDMEKEYMIGWSMLTCLAFLIVTNIIIILYYAMK